MARRILTVLGTRPEAIKLAPLIRALSNTQGMQHAVCFTGQHRQMALPVLEFFGIVPDYHLQLSTGNELSGLYAEILSKLQDPVRAFAPDFILVQGDTTSALAGATAAYFNDVLIGHVEAGLRSGDLNAPWPEEGNRKMIAAIAAWHFAPTRRAKTNLLAEGVPEDQIRVCGNTGIDSLEYARKLLQSKPQLQRAYAHSFSYLNPTKKLILVTGHRRESFGGGLRNILRALKRLASRSDVQILYPVHLNPNVAGPVRDELQGTQNIFLELPVSYPEMVYLMERAVFIVSDSGGIQEEAPSFGKHVLITRDVTERQEVLETGVAELVGTDEERILTAALRLLDRISGDTADVRLIRNPFGDGHASQRIVAAITGAEHGDEANDLFERGAI